MKNIQCKRCFFFTPEWCPKKRDSLDPDLIRDCQYYRTKTKADRIRSMSDEELARFIARFEDLCVRHAGALLADDIEELVKGRLEWLREEYKE